MATALKLTFCKGKKRWRKIYISHVLYLGYGKRKDERPANLPWRSSSDAGPRSMPWTLPQNPTTATMNGQFTFAVRCSTG